MLVSVREKVSTLKQQGRSLAEVVTAKPTAKLQREWGGFVIDSNTFTAVVYAAV